MVAGCGWNRGPASSRLDRARVDRVASSVVVVLLRVRGVRVLLPPALLRGGCGGERSDRQRTLMKLRRTTLRLRR